MANSDSCVFYMSFQFIYDRIILVSVPTAFTVLLCTGVVSLSLEAKIKNVQQAHWKLWLECAAWDNKFALETAVRTPVFNEVKRTIYLLLYDDFVLLYGDFVSVYDDFDWCVMVQRTYTSHGSHIY